MPRRLAASARVPARSMASSRFALPGPRAIWSPWKIRSRGRRASVGIRGKDNLGGRTGRRAWLWRSALRDLTPWPPLQRSWRGGTQTLVLWVAKACGGFEDSGENGFTSSEDLSIRKAEDRATDRAESRFGP